MEEAWREGKTIRFRQGGFEQGARALAQEMPIAISYQGSTHAVMMATPQDLTEFALGFSLSEEIIRHRDDIEAVEPVLTDRGIDLQIRLKAPLGAALSARRRQMAGPVGCGLCGIESLDQAMRNLPQIAPSGFSVSPTDIVSAMDHLAGAQKLNHRTHAVHAAGFFRPQYGLVDLREDVGRHNALDKLIGALMLKDEKPEAGMIVVTSRLSVEMVQKAAMCGAPVLAAISAPTALAIRTAQDVGLTLIGIVRGAEFEIFTGAGRVK